MADGQNTWECTQFRTNFAVLTDIINDHLTLVAISLDLQQADLISANNQKKAAKECNDEIGRAGGLMQILLTAVSSDKTTFLKIGHILHAKVSAAHRSTIEKIFNLPEANAREEQANVQADGAAEDDDEAEAMMNIN